MLSGAQNVSLIMKRLVFSTVFRIYTEVFQLVSECNKVMDNDGVLQDSVKIVKKSIIFFFFPILHLHFMHLHRRIYNQINIIPLLGLLLIQGYLIMQSVDSKKKKITGKFTRSFENRKFYRFRNALSEFQVCHFVYLALARPYWKNCV